MTVFLIILKVIGLILLAVLGILLLLVLAVLFVPIRYRAEGTYQNRFWGKARITWLFHLFSVSICYEDGPKVLVKAAGIRLFPGKKKEEMSAEKKPAEGMPAEEKAAGKQSAEEKSAGYESAEGAPAKEKIPDQSRSAEAPPQNTPPIQNVENGVENLSGASSTQEKQGPLARLWVKVYAFFRKCREKYAGIYARIKSVRDHYSYYMELLRKEENQQLIRLTLSQLKRMIRHILPRRLEICIHVGTGDPASTGQILAVAGMLYPLFGEQLKIIPDFEEKQLDGTFYMKGRITVFVMLLCVLRVIANRNFRRLIKILRKKGGNRNGG